MSQPDLNNVRSAEAAIREDVAAGREEERLIVGAETATEIVNRARAIVQRRIYDLDEQGRIEEAARLRRTAKPLLVRLQRSVDHRDEAAVEAVIGTWGPLVRDEAQLWGKLDG